MNLQVMKPCNAAAIMSTGAFFAQHDDLGVFHYFPDCLNLMDI